MDPRNNENLKMRYQSRIAHHELRLSDSLNHSRNSLCNETDTFKIKPKQFKQHK